MINCVYPAPVPEMVSLASAAKREVSLVVPYECRALPCFSREGAPFTYFDPMIGFGPSREEDIRLLGSIREMAGEVPVLVGASRKRVIKRLTGVKTPGKDIAGNLAVVVWAQLSGASVVRVHDVRKMSVSRKLALFQVIDKAKVLLYRHIHIKWRKLGKIADFCLCFKRILKNVYSVDKSFSVG